MMSGSTSNEGLNTELLRRKVDDLTTGWIVNESRPAPEVLQELSADLAAARQQAEQAGMSGAARIADLLAEAVSRAATDTSTDLLRLNEVLNNGLAELEQALESGAADEPEAQRNRRCGHSSRTKYRRQNRPPRHRK